MNYVQVWETKSLCPVCLGVIPAKKVVEGDNIYLEKTCSEHGDYKVLLWHDVQSYKDRYGFDVGRVKPKKLLTKSKKGCPYDCGLCPDHKQHTCVVVMEVTNQCNLKCPICFASAREMYEYEPDIDVVKEMYKTVVDYTEKPICVQISGGEPTIRNDLPDIVSLGKEMGIDYIEVNTNGIRLAKDMEYFHRLKESGVDALYFSFDGLTSEVYRKKCGVDLLNLKLKTIENCAKLEVGVVLVPVLVQGVNYDQIGDIIQFAKERVPVVNSVHFQPISHFGRYPHTPTDEDRITIPDVLRAIQDQTKGELKVENFTSTSCPNVHCDARSYSLLMEDGKLLPLTQSSIGASGKVRDIAKKTREAISDLWRYPISSEGCECVPGTWMDLIERASKYYLTVSVMAFQDVWNIELERVQECCIHVVTPDRRLIPFCLFNVSGINGKTLYRHNILSKFATPTA